MGTLVGLALTVLRVYRVCRGCYVVARYPCRVVLTVLRVYRAMPGTYFIDWFLRLSSRGWRVGTVLDYFGTVVQGMAGRDSTRFFWYCCPGDGGSGQYPIFLVLLSRGWRVGTVPGF